MSENYTLSFLIQGVLHKRDTRKYSAALMLKFSMTEKYNSRPHLHFEWSVGYASETEKT